MPDQAKETPKPINELYIYLTKDKDGRDSVVMIPDENIVMPCITSKEESLPLLERVVQNYVNTNKTSATLAKFTVREDVKTIEERRILPGESVKL